MTTTVSVIVRAKNEEQTIARTLELIQDQTVPPHEIILVDNDSTDCTRRIAARFGCRIVDVKDEDFNHAYSCNLGAAHSRGDLLVFTNGHAFPRDRDWLRSGARHFVDPTVAGAYSLPAVDGRASWSERWVERVKGLLFGPARLRVIDTPSIFIGLGLMNTGCAMLRRDLWERHHFDEKLSLHGGGEDSEWGFYYLRQGYRIVEDPAFAVYHCHGDSPVRYLGRVFYYYVTYFLAYRHSRQAHAR